MGNRCECDRKQPVDVQKVPRPPAPDETDGGKDDMTMSQDANLDCAIPALGEKGVIGIDPYVGIWHRESDMVLMAEICANGSMIWSSNFKVTPGSGSRFTRAQVTNNSSLEICLNGNPHTAKLVAGNGGDRMLWSDGETWVRGFEPYVGLWCRKGDGQLCAGICPDGRLIWNIDSKEETMLQLSPAGGLVMKSRKAYHTAALEPASGASTNKELRWSDGDSWVYRPTAQACFATPTSNTSPMVADVQKPAAVSMTATQAP